MKLAIVFSFFAFAFVAFGAQTSLDCTLVSTFSKVGDVVGLIQKLIASHSDGETFTFPKNASVINGRRSLVLGNPTTFSMVLFESRVRSLPVTKVRAGFGQLIVNCTQPDGSTGGRFLSENERDSFVISFSLA